MKYLYHTLMIFTALVLIGTAVKLGDNYLLLTAAIMLGIYGLISGYYEDKISSN